VSDGSGLTRTDYFNTPSGIQSEKTKEIGGSVWIKLLLLLFIDNIGVSKEQHKFPPF
jgi:hypothetical protein